MSKELETFEIAFGTHRGQSKNGVWTRKKLWKKLEKPLHDTAVNFAQYSALSVDEKGRKKAAAGWYKGGHYKDGLRKLPNLLGLSFVALDLDNLTPAQLENIRMGLVEISRWDWFMHTTRSHCPERPRVRLIIFLDRMVNLDEANALARYLALELADDPAEAIEIPDQVSFRNNQISYWPSISRDQEYWTDRNDGETLCVDDYLAEHPTWQDVSTLPMQEGETSAAGSDPNRKMEDPREKQGLIGAFCRAYGIEEAIAKFIPNIYVEGESSGSDTRYTYALGSGANGAVVYDDGLFIHSNHGTDPIEGSANAWDMVRIHLYGELDDKAHGNTSPGNMPSFKAMVERAKTDPGVKRELFASWAEDFDDDDDDDDEIDLSDVLGDEDNGDDDEIDLTDVLGDEDDDDDDDDDEPPTTPGTSSKDKKKKGKGDWSLRLTVTKEGLAEKTRHNAAVILQGDVRIARCIARNELTGAPAAVKLLRFKKMDLHQEPIPKHGRKWSDVDMAALATALSAPREFGGYGVEFADEQIRKALLQAAQKNTYNPVLDAIHETPWDGVSRVETFFIDHLGCEDNAYHREVALAWFPAAVGRLHKPGLKFDFVPILEGIQEVGKSGLIAELAFGFFGELSKDFHNAQRMVESIRGKWILEIAELSGFRLSEVEDIKAFFSRQSDTIRLAYRENEEDFPRRCVFMGTSNKEEYLRDPTGNRRFWPIKTTVGRVDFARLKPLIPQLWAEAEVLFLEAQRRSNSGEPIFNLYSDEARATAKTLQGDAREIGPEEPVREVIQVWVDTPVTEAEARGHDAGGSFDGEDGEQMYLRNVVSAGLVVRHLGNDPVIRANIRNSKLLGDAVKGLDGLTNVGNTNRKQVLGGKAVRGNYSVRDPHNPEPFIPVPDA